MQDSNSFNNDILEFFGKSLQDLTLEEFNQIRKSLLAKYHPDKFSNLNNEVVLEMANTQFKKIKELCDKIEIHFKNFDRSREIEIENLKKNSVFTANGLPFEIITRDKDLKYKLLQTHYRLLRAGDKINIPNTNAYLFAEEDHVNQSVGFNETIKLFLTFNETDNVEKIAEWMYVKLFNTESKLLINKNLVEIDYFKILALLLKVTRKLLQ